MSQKSVQFIQKARESGIWEMITKTLHSRYLNGDDIDDSVENNLKGILPLYDGSIDPYDSDFYEILSVLKREVLGNEW